MSATQAERAVAIRCIEIVQRIRHEFLSEEYAVGQPESSTAERFACSQVVAAIEAEFGMSASQQVSA